MATIVAHPLLQRALIADELVHVGAGGELVSMQQVANEPRDRQKYYLKGQKILPKRKPDRPNRAIAFLREG